MADHVPPDGRQVGVIIHHVASMYPIEIHIATEIARGNPVVGVTWAAVSLRSTRSTRRNTRRPAKRKRLSSSGGTADAAAEAVRAFTDEELDRAAPVSLNADAPLTTQFFIEDHALRHAWHHLGRSAQRSGCRTRPERLKDGRARQRGTAVAAVRIRRTAHAKFREFLRAVSFTCR